VYDYWLKIQERKIATLASSKRLKLNFIFNKPPENLMFEKPENEIFATKNSVPGFFYRRADKVYTKTRSMDPAYLTRSLFHISVELFVIAIILISPRTHQSQPSFLFFPSLQNHHQYLSQPFNGSEGHTGQSTLKPPHHHQPGAPGTQPSRDPSHSFIIIAFPFFLLPSYILKLAPLPSMANASLQSFLIPQHHSFINTGIHDGYPSNLLKHTTNSSGSISFRLYSNTSPSVTTTSTPNSSTPTPVTPAAAEKPPAPTLDLLSRQLATGDYRQADETTRALLIKLAGESARRRGYVFFSEVQFISVEDLRAIDELWREHSNGKFGYSVQKRLWEKARRDFTSFFIKVSWMKKLDTEIEQYNYRAFPDEFVWEIKDDTPEGHLPLTNALRGTQLLGNILMHPAFEDGQEEEATESVTATTSGQSKDDSKGRERPMKDFKPNYSF
jgi:hypothetical protein